MFSPECLPNFTFMIASIDTKDGEDNPVLVLYLYL